MIWLQAINVVTVVFLVPRIISLPRYNLVDQLKKHEKDYWPQILRDGARVNIHRCVSAVHNVDVNLKVRARYTSELLPRSIV